MGRGGEDEIGRMGERFPGQNAKAITEKFVLGIVYTILILSWIHLPFKDS